MDELKPEPSEPPAADLPVMVLSVVPTAFGLMPMLPTAAGPIPLPDIEVPAEVVFEEMGEKAGIPTLATLESAAIRRALRITGNHRAAAAKLLGIDRRTLYRKLAK